MNDHDQMQPSRLSDQALLTALARAAAHERQAVARVIALLAEVDARRLYLGEGCPSLYAYCVERLGLSEHAAYHRIEAARAVRRFPAIQERLADGRLSLTAVTLLRPHLTEENGERLFDAAAHKSKREVEVLVSGLAPRRDVRPSIRRLPAVDTGPERMPGAPSAGVDAAPAGAPSVRNADCSPIERPPGPEMVTATTRSCPTPPAQIRVLAPTRYSLRVTLSARAHDNLRRAQDLLRHANPSGDPAIVVERALALLVEHLEEAKLAALKPRVAARHREGPVAPARGRTRTTEYQRSRESPGSRHIPAAVRRAVWERDQGRCAFVGTGGRCTATGLLEFHHRVPFADGGKATLENIELRCRPHNAYESLLWSGSVEANASVDAP